MRGLFVRDGPGVLTDCETGYTWAFDATDRVLKCWDGSAWRHSCLTQYLVPVSDGDKFIAVPDGAGTAAQVLTSNGAGAYPSFQAAAVATWLGELTGLGLSHGVDTDHDITIAVGAAASYHATITSRVLLNLTTALTKQIDAAWAVGTNQGGLFSGAVGNTTWYHVFLIRRSDTGVVDAGFDTSVTAANIPASYDQYRRIGSVLTDGAANILAFVQDGDWFAWAAPVLDVDSDNPGTNAVTATLTVPPDVTVQAVLTVLRTGAVTASTPVYLSEVAVTDAAPSLTAAPLGINTVESANGFPEASQILVRTNTSKQIRYRLPKSGAGGRLLVPTPRSV